MVYGKLNISYRIEWKGNIKMFKRKNIKYKMIKNRVSDIF